MTLVTLVTLQVAEWRPALDPAGTGQPGRPGGCCLAAAFREGGREGLLEPEGVGRLPLHQGQALIEVDC